MNITNLIAFRVLELFALLQGFTVNYDWDPRDPSCMQNHGEHRVWTIQACIPPELEVDRSELHEALYFFCLAINYTDEYHINIEPYDVQLYKGEGGKTFAYLSCYV